MHTLAQQRVTDRQKNLNPLIEIAWHPVGATGINFLLPAVGKEENPAVLQETSDNAAHTDPIAHSAYARTQRTHPPYDQVNIHARLRSEEHTSELQSRGHLVCRLL